MDDESAKAAHPGEDGGLQKDEHLGGQLGISNTEESALDQELHAAAQAEVHRRAAIFNKIIDDELYQASPIKRRRASRDGVAARRAALREIVARGRPMTVRQVYYQGTVLGVVDKTEADYNKVQTDLVVMRRAGDLPYSWLADSTRWQRKPDTFSSVEHALNETARFYRKALWDDVPAHVEVWLEKDALAGVVYPVTELYDVPLMVTRGYASLSFLHEAARYISSIDVPTYIYHLGDYDPSGVDASRKVHETLMEMAPRAEIHFGRVAVFKAQIDYWKLPSRPTKKSDTRASKFNDISVELDALPPETLRKLVQVNIEDHLPRAQLDVLKVAEESERELIKALVGRVTT